MTNIKEQLEELKTEQEQLKEKITSLEIDMSQKEKIDIDFNKRIGRYLETLAIKWDKYLKSYSDWDIVYTYYGGSSNQVYNNNITYRKWKLKDLKCWDIFILKDDLKDIGLYNFNIFVWEDENWDYGIEYLDKDFWLEVIKSSTYCKIYFEDKDILIFNRF